MAWFFTRFRVNVDFWNILCTDFLQNSIVETTLLSEISTTVSTYVCEYLRYGTWPVINVAQQAGAFSFAHCVQLKGTNNNFEHFRLYLCLLVLLMGTSAQDQKKTTTTTPKPPKLDTLVTIHELEKTKNHMRFCDTDKPIYDDDIFCNRIVAITAHDGDEKFGTGRVIVSGIFIDDRRILTSYTPFRILRQKMNRQKIYINYITAKAYIAKTMLVGYVYERIKLSCARQIVAMEHKVIVDEQWHGKDKTHTPMHDLMIMKTESPIKFIVDETWHNVAKDNVNYDVLLVGPMETQIADERDEFPDTFKIISLGFMDDDHVFNKNHLHTSKEYEYDDKVLEDCEEWFPRDWGYFFCVKNDDDFVSIGSGALLVGSEKGSDKGYGKVFGIGSFMLKKNKASILVFTDIRPYLDAMNMTCNGWDGN